MGFYCNHNFNFQVGNGSRSTLVKGACGIGLGLSCSSVLIQAVDFEDSGADNGTIWRQELDVVDKMVKVFCQLIFRLTHSSSDILRSICEFPIITDDDNLVSNPEPGLDAPASREDDIWGVAGLVIGLGNSISALYRGGSQNLVVKIKSMLISWVSCTERCEVALSIGSYLALPVVVTFCLRVELIDYDELEYLIHCYKDRISTLLLCKDPDNVHQSLLMAVCVGAGNLLACILNEGVHPIDVKEINELLQLYRKCYSSPFPLISMGGMLGAVNSLGAGADIYPENPDQVSPRITFHELKVILHLLIFMIFSDLQLTNHVLHITCRTHLLLWVLWLEVVFVNQL